MDERHLDPLSFSKERGERENGESEYEWVKHVKQEWIDIIWIVDVGKESPITSWQR